jgi:hypothetical protein
MNRDRPLFKHGGPTAANLKRRSTKRRYFVSSRLG